MGTRPPLAATNSLENLLLNGRIKGFAGVFGDLAKPQEKPAIAKRRHETQKSASQTEKRKPPPSTSGAAQPGGGLRSAKEAYFKSLDKDSLAPEPKRSASKERMTGLEEAGRVAFTRKMVHDNMKRGGPGRLNAEEDLDALLSRVQASDTSLPVLDLRGNQQFSWLSHPQRVEALTKIAAGSALSELLLDSLHLDLAVAEALAAAVRSHTKLQRLSVERNGLSETALIMVAEACAGHPSLTILSVANQCNQELLTQPALLALISAMERTPKMTQLHVGRIIDPSLRRGLESVTMSNRDLLRQQRVAAGTKDTRSSSKPPVDWEGEAVKIASNQPHTYSTDRAGEGGGQTYNPVLNLWRAAKDTERAAVLDSFGYNSNVTALVLVNSLVTDALAAAHLATMLRSNSSITSLNLESNMISSAGIEAIAAALGANSTLTQLKLANQGLAASQASELSLASAVDANHSLLNLTVDLRNTHAREIIQKALSRNREERRLKRRSSTEPAPTL